VCIAISSAFKSLPFQRSLNGVSKTVVYWTGYFNNPDKEKREVGRIVKNIIFPGIYTDYADTKEAKKVVKVVVKEEKKKDAFVRNDPAEFKNWGGTYNMVDAKTAPVYGSGVIQDLKLRPITRPQGFVAPVPKKAASANQGIACLPDVSTFPKPSRPIIMYEYEASADCRKVREAITMLDLPVEYRPCPGGSAGFVDNMKTLTLGKQEFPFIIDNGARMIKPQLGGAKTIISYLFDSYGPGADKIPSSLKGGGISFGSGGGPKIRKDARPDFAKLKPIVLYGWEGAPYVKPVREALTALALAHVMVNCAQGSSNRSKLQSKAGTFQVPYIEDPNTGVAMFESVEIIKYLEQTYTI